jgi:two-component system chemotaxis sensor kinase CheA
MDDLLREFVSETAERLDALENALEALPDDAGTRRALRLVHAVKGAAGFLPVPRIEALAHVAENFLAEPAHFDGARAALSRMRWLLDEIARDGVEPPGHDDDVLAAAMAPEPAPALAPPEAPLPPTMRIEIAAMTRLGALAAELVAARDELFALARRQGDSAFEPLLQTLANLTAEMQDGIAAARVQSVAQALRHLPRLTASLARDLGKDVAFELTGGETTLDRALVEPVRTSIDQLVRNAIHHGIERPDVRVAGGKPATGTVAVAAEPRDGRLALTVRDDGAGLDLETIRLRAIAAGLVAASTPFTAADAVRLAFTPGVTSAAEPSRTAGRGIGLEMVKAGVESLGGVVTMTSDPGHGTAITLDLPAVPGNVAKPAKPAPVAAPVVRLAPPIAPAAIGTGRPRVLLVEDSPFFRSMLTPVLERAGYEVVACTSRAAALDTARGSERGFVAVVSDVDAPDVAAPDFAAAVRAERTLGAAPIIGLASERRSEESFARVVTKFDREGLVAALNDMAKSAA